MLNMRTISNDTGYWSASSDQIRSKRPYSGAKRRSTRRFQNTTSFWSESKPIDAASIPVNSDNKMKGVIRDSIYWKPKKGGFTEKDPKECGNGPMGIPVYQCEPILKLNESLTNHRSIDTPITNRKRPKRSKKRSKSYGRLPGPEASPRKIVERPLSVSSQPIDTKGKTSRRNSVQTLRHRFASRGIDSSIPSIHSDGDIQKAKGKHSNIHVPAATYRQGSRQDNYHHESKVQRSVLHSQRSSNTVETTPTRAAHTTSSAFNKIQQQHRPDTSRSNITTQSTINTTNTEDPMITIPLSRLHQSIGSPQNCEHQTSNNFTAASPIHPIKPVEQRHRQRQLPIKSNSYNSNVSSHTERGKKTNIVRQYGTILASGSNQKTIKKGDQTPPLRLGTSSTQEPISSPSVPSSLQRTIRQPTPTTTTPSHHQHQNSAPMLRNQISSNITRPNLTPMAKDAIASFTATPRPIQQPQQRTSAITTQQQLHSTHMSSTGQRSINNPTTTVVPNIVISPPIMNTYSNERKNLSGVRPIATIPYSADRGPVADANYLLRRPGSLDPVEDAHGQGGKIVPLHEGFTSYDQEEEYDKSGPSGHMSSTLHPKKNQAIILKTNQAQDFNDFHNRALDNTNDLLPESGNSRSLTNRKWACCAGTIRDSASILSDDMSSNHLPINSMTTPPSMTTHDMGMGPQITELDESDIDTVLSSVTDASRWVPYTTIHQQGFVPHTPKIHRPLVSNDFLSGLQQLGTLDTATWYGHQS